MTTAQAYQQVIDLLMSNAVDYKQISIALAKKFPEIFVELCTVTVPTEKWVKVVVDFMINNQKVNAIKEVRSTTGFGLKEAKEVMDHVQDLMAAKGYCHPYGPSPTPLDQQAQEVLQKLEKYIFNNVPNKSQGVF